jgi:hypothetical protein
LGVDVTQATPASSDPGNVSGYTAASILFDGTRITASGAPGLRFTLKFAMRFADQSLWSGMGR